MKHSFEEILLEHGATVSRLVSGYTPPGEEREDLLQDIWLAVWKALPRFRGESLLRTYVLRIAHNRASTWLVRRRSAVRIDDHDTVVDPSASPEQKASGRQDVAHLMQAIRTLPLGQRQVLSLVLEGLTHREVGEVLGLAENAVSVRLHRARQTVRLAMGEEHE